MRMASATRSSRTTSRCSPTRASSRKTEFRRRSCSPTAFLRRVSARSTRKCCANVTAESRCSNAATKKIEEENVSELTLAGLGERVGHQLGLSDWVTIDQPRIDTFAACTGDRQWIHVDVERAKRESPFRAPIAHGYLTLGMVAPLAMQVGVIPNDAAAGLNYGIDKVRFLAPVPAGARVRVRVVLCGSAPREGGQVIMKTQNTLEVEGAEKPDL